MSTFATLRTTARALRRSPELFEKRFLSRSCIALALLRVEISVANHSSTCVGRPGTMVAATSFS